MATNTTNYNLVKPSDGDKFDIDHFNGNADIIDRKLKELSDAVEAGGSGGDIDLTGYVQESELKTVNGVSLIGTGNVDTSNKYAGLAGKNYPFLEILYPRLLDTIQADMLFGMTVQRVE